MNTERLDSKAVQKVSGPSWESLRPAFGTINDTLLDVSETARGDLTTIYIKYSSTDTSGNPYAVVWIKKSTEIVVGLALAEETQHRLLGDPPKGCKYAGLTKYFVVKAESDVPSALSAWAQEAYENRSGGETS